MKKLLLKTLLCIFMFTTVNAQQACYTEWQNKATVEIDNTNGDTLIDYELAIFVNTQALITAGEMKADGGDIRFSSNENCCTPLCFFIDSGINTDSTLIYVKIPFVEDGATVSINMLYGNSSATDMSDAECVFTLFDGFDDMASSTFSDICGTVTTTYNNGTVDVAWTNSGLISSDDTLSSDFRYTLESKIDNTSGNWPGIYLAKVNSTQSYSALLGSNQVRISYGAATANHCSSHSWAGSTFPYTNILGIWSLTWANTGEQYAIFPSVGELTSTDANITLDEDLVVHLGGIESGSGSMEVDWIRARKYAAIVPTVTISATLAYEIFTVDLGTDLTICDEVTLDAGSVGNTYTWSNGDATATTLINNSSTITIEVEDQFGCVAKDTIIVTKDTVNVNVSYAADVFTAEALMATFRWLDCDNNNLAITGETAATFEPTATGNYAVEVTQGACVDTSNCYAYTFVPTGINDISSNSYNVYPNPTNGIINIEFKEVLNSIRLLNITGQTVKEFDAQTHQLDISEFHQGIYLLEISNEEGTSIIKVIKK